MAKLHLQKNVELHLGDCLEVMRSMADKSVDAVITDPPYGIKRDKGFKGFGGFGTPIARTQYHGEWDSHRPDKSYFDELLRVGRGYYWSEKRHSRGYDSTGGA